MRSKKFMGLVLSIVCISGIGIYSLNVFSELNARQSILENAIPIKDDYVVVYSDGEYTATISKEEYDTLSEHDKANFDNTYKKIIEIIEKNE